MELVSPEFAPDWSISAMLPSQSPRRKEQMPDETPAMSVTSVLDWGISGEMFGPISPVLLIRKYGATVLSLSLSLSLNAGYVALSNCSF